MFSYSWVKTYCVILANAGVDSLPLQRVSVLVALCVYGSSSARVYFSSSLSLADLWLALACKTVANVMQTEAVKVLILSLFLEL